ncbi:MAG: hypothetical protein ACRC7N_11310 [Clostridium sp.]
MSRECEHCNWIIGTKYLLNQKDYEKIICPNCGRVLKVTKLSKLLCKYSQILGSVVVVILPLSIKLKLIMLGVWIIITILILPALLYDYEKVIK